MYQKTQISLVSNTNFSKILPSNGLRPGSGKVGQGGLKDLHLWCHSLKNPQPSTKKFFFECSLGDLPSLLSLWTALYPELHSCKATCDSLFSCEILETGWTRKW